MAKKKQIQATFTDENVYSPINDPHIKNDIAGSEIWNKCFHESEVEANMSSFANMHCYTIRFDGLTPVQVTRVERLK